MFLQLSDFTGRPYRIPNQEESPDLEAFIAREEKSILICLMGYEMYTEFAANAVTSDPEDRWAALLNGAEYSYSNKTYKYNGVVDMLVPAVYSRWLDKGAYKFTNVGYMQNNAPNESKVMEDQEPFRIESWNDFVRKAYDCGNQKNTWYGFMRANESDYPTWEHDVCDACFQYQNRFGL